MPELVGFVRVVELPGDSFDVHLVVEVTRAGGRTDPPDYRALMTNCGQVGFRQTTRTTNACHECERAIPDAVPSAIAACRLRLGEW